jgi:ssDNA-binding Zn-finger/Zn-ribbon topoisomerase 1
MLRMDAMIQSKPEPACPDCGAKMVLRRPKPGQDWKAFWGCGRYPSCKGTRRINPETGKPEDDEGAELYDRAGDYDPY